MTNIENLIDRHRQKQPSNLRKMRGTMTQLKLAKETGVEQYRLSKIELGQTPSYRDAMILARYFGVDPEELFPVKAYL